MKIDDDQVARAWHLVATEDPTEVVRWAARRGDRIQGSWAQSPIELVQFAHAYSDWDFYIQPNPTRKKHGVRCSGEDISRWRWFLIDIDPVGDAFLTADLMLEIVAWAQSAMNSYVGTKVTNTWVYSGRGVQIWVPLGSATNVHPNPLAHISPGNGNLRYAIQGAQRYWLARLDSRRPFPEIVIDAAACADLPRLFRCPGTINRKTGEMALIGFGSSVTPNEGLAQKILAWTPEKEKTPPLRPLSQAPLPKGWKAPSWQSVVAYMTREGADFITYGATEPGRHRACCAAARSLAEQGVEEDDIVRALLVGAEKCRPDMMEFAAGGYFERTARDAVRLAQRRT